jgi:hypothetical protein
MRAVRAGRVPAVFPSSTSVRLSRQGWARSICMVRTALPIERPTDLVEAAGGLQIERTRTLEVADGPVQHSACFPQGGVPRSPGPHSDDSFGFDQPAPRSIALPRGGKGRRSAARNRRNPASAVANLRRPVQGGVAIGHNRAMPGRVSAIGAKARKTTTALRARMGKSYKTISRRAGRLTLLPAVAFALGAGLAIAVAAYGFLHRIMPASEDKAAPIDITRVSLTVVAGVGGVVALVIAYRRQRDIEQSRFVERFGAAASQLGATDVAVRIAGVYAMASAADESDGLRRQQCIDVLCGYLRLPYDPDHGSSARTKLVTTVPRVDGGETEEHIEYRQNDREVR